MMSWSKDQIADTRLCFFLLFSRNTRSGWPEADFLVATEYQRQGYGTEMFHAVMNAWWNLPRDRSRRQLNPLIVPGLEPGDKVVDGVALSWEEKDTAVSKFFAKILDDKLVSIRGTAEDFDRRPGRTHNLVKMYGLLVTNPVPVSQRQKEWHSSST